MAKQTLPTNFKDDVLNTSMSGKRKWNISQNADGTYSITDVTTYDQVGSEFGAGELNATNQAVNASADAGKIIDDPDTAEATTEEGYIAGVQLFNHVNDSLKTVKTYVDEEGKLHFVDSEGADSVLPFSGFKRHYSASITLSTSSKFYELGFKPKFIALDAQWFYDEELNKCWYSNGINNGVPVGTWTANNLFKFDSIEETGFYGTAKSKSTRFLFAFG